MQISDAEWVVINLIWSSSPIEAAEVIDRIAASRCINAASTTQIWYCASQDVNSLFDSRDWRV